MALNMVFNAGVSFTKIVQNAMPLHIYLIKGHILIYEVVTCRGKWVSWGGGGGGGGI